jgi:hypothetical protein
MSSIQEHMACAPGMITAELHEPLLEDSITDVPYNPVPQTPSAADFDCAVSINFPEMLMVTPTATPESTTTTDDPPTYTDTQTAGGGFLPAKLQPPAFSVHRCHHRGMDRRGEEDAFELPFGFPEVIQHLHTIPSHVSSRHANDIVSSHRPQCYHTGFHIQDKSYESMPCHEEGVEAFECHITASEAWVYITVEREGAILVYDCYRDQEVNLSQLS